jgi:ATP-dependent protease Clp ATPase subunit
MPERKTKDQDVLRCSFCGKPQGDVKKLIAGPSVYICNECVSICQEFIAEDDQSVAQHSEPELPQQRGRESIKVAEQCSFCDKQRAQVRYLRPVPNVYICDECEHEIMES